MRPARVKRAFTFPFRTREDVRKDVRDEFDLHIELRTQELVEAGLTERDAHAQAVREFGDAEAGARTCLTYDTRIERRRSIARFLGECRQDARLGIRLIARNPWQSGAAIVTLAVAIGGNTAIFSVVNALLFKPLPVRAPHELAAVHAGESQMSWPDYQELAARNNVFSDTVAHRRVVAGLAGGDAPVRSWGEQTTINYFRVLGVPAVLGRAYMPWDSRRDLIVLAHHVWQARFAADPSIVGRRLNLNGRPVEVLGVMPPGFRGVAPAGLLHDFWIPIDDSASNALLRGHASRFEVFGRLVAGAGHTQAEASLRVLARQIRADRSEVPETFSRVQVFPLESIGAFRGMADLILPVLAFLTVMSLMAVLVLLIGCANIGGLLLGRAAARRKEIALRLALGAGRGRLVRQLLTESFVLAIAGGAAGVLLTYWLTAVVNPFLSGLPVPMAFDLRIDRRVLAYALAISALAALVFGLAPARRAARFDLISSLKDEAAGSAVRQRLRRGLVVGQVVVCTMLLIWSGLFLRSLGNIGTIDPGFDPHGVLLARIELDEMAYDRRFGERLFLDLEQQVRLSPGVVSAGIATVVPLSLDNEEFDIVRNAASAGDGSQIHHRVFANRLTPGWFETVRIPFVAGRDFTANDREGAPPVAIVNETLARQLWGGNAIGKQVTVPVPSERVAEVVGIVRDSKYWTLGEDVAPTIYLPFQQSYARWMTIHARTGDTLGTSRTITEFVRRRAPGVFVDITTLDETVATAMVPARVGAWVTSAFAVVAMSLAALGVYGLVAFSVAQRTREIGLRKAIGADTGDLVRLIVGENLLLTLVGFAAGMLLGILGANVLRTFIAGVSPMDPIALAASAMLVCGAALVASAVPAARAALVNPLVVFRDA